MTGIYYKLFISICVRSIIEKLGEERISKVKIIGKEEVEGSFYGQLVLSKSESNSLDEQLAKAARKAGEVCFPTFVSLGSY